MSIGPEELVCGFDVDTEPSDIRRLMVEPVPDDDDEIFLTIELSRCEVEDTHKLPSHVMRRVTVVGRCAEADVAAVTIDLSWRCRMWIALLWSLLLS